MNWCKEVRASSPEMEAFVAKKGPDQSTVDDHFAGKDGSVREVYDCILTTVRELGRVHEEPKKTSIHLVRSSALAGVQVRKQPGRVSGRL